MTLPLTDAWQACQRRVNALEREYATMMLLYCRDEGPPPDDGMKARLEAMREEAAALLSRALGDLDARAADVDATLRGVEGRTSMQK